MKELTLVPAFLSNSEWAITSTGLETIYDVVRLKMNGMNDVAAIEAALGRKLSNTYNSFITDKGEAIIPVEGALVKKLNMFESISGGTSTQMMSADFKSAIKNKDVKEVHLLINSPGGTVDGVQQFTEAIYGARGQKPIKAFIDGQGCSGGYLIASACDEIYANETALVGSIGVITAHFNREKMYEKEGVEKTHIYAGKYKAVGVDTKPLSKADKDYIQAHVDETNTWFVDTVARNRGIEPGVVLDTMANGKIFGAKEALEIGMIEGIVIHDEYLDGNVAPDDEEKLAVSSVTVENETEKNKTQSIEEEANMDLKDLDVKSLRAGRPDMVTQIQDESRVGYVSQADHDSVVTEKEKLSTENQKLTDEVKEKDKALALAEENSNKAVASAVEDSVLAESRLPAGLHGKVKGSVDFHDHLVSGEPFTLEADSVSAFESAFKAEVADWESKISPSGAQLSGDSRDDGLTEDADADTRYAQELARGISGAIRSDAAH